MMNFPASPTAGQEFASGGRTYVWGGYAWNLKAGTSSGGGGSAIAVSDTAPATPAANSLWWESDTGGLYLNYNDGNTSQFVQVNGARDAFNPIRLNPTTITRDAAVPTGYNGMSAGPISVASGVTVSVSDGSTWTVV